MDLKPIIERARETALAVKERDGMPGVAVALVSGDEVVWMECFGEVDRPGSRPIDPRTIFSLQSTSKTFTATAVMLAVQQGLLDLGAPITAYLPEFTVHSRHESEPEARITLRHLLSHRAGFTHEAPLGGNFDPELETRSPNFPAHVASISDTWLRYPVGQRYAYSNLGIDLAGEALARVTGVPFAEALRQLIFDPLGMADLSADAAVYGPCENRAIGHQPGFDAVPVRIPIEASGGVYSSVADMTRFARFLMHRGAFEGRALLEPALWDEMHTPPFPGIPYALGVMRLPLRLERARPVLMNHNGGGYGFGSCFTYCPEHELAWIALYNGQMHPSPAPFDAVGLRTVLEAEFGPPAAKPLPKDPVVAPLRDALAPYCGAYVAGQAVVTVGWDGEALAVHTPLDEAANPLAFIGPLRAYVAGGAYVGQIVRLYPPAGVQPARLEVEFDEGTTVTAFMAGGGVDFNEGIGPGPPGSVGDAYDALLGDYRIIQWGVPFLTIRLSRTNGRLYLDHMRMTEHAPGLFFGPDGEALDLTGETPAFRNIPLQRIESRLSSNALGEPAAFIQRRFPWYQRRMIGKLNHVGVATPSIEDSWKLYRDVLGVTDITEKRALPEQGVWVSFVNLPNAQIELIEPYGENSPIAVFLERNPRGGQHHVCFEVHDIIVARDEMRAKGATVLGNGEPRIGAHGVPVIFVHPKDMGGVLVELMQEPGAAH